MYKRYINFIIIVGKPIIYKREDFYPTNLLIIKLKTDQLLQPYLQDYSTNFSAFLRRL